MTLTQQDICNFWIRLYFGTTNPTQLRLAAIERAYRDFNRTMHGIAKTQSNSAKLSLCNLLIEITNEGINNTFNQVDFDIWHKGMCDKLKLKFITLIGYEISYGQAQKWINMSLKYMSALGNTIIIGVEKNYKYFHIPIDNIIQDKLKNHNINRIPISWSRLDNYDVYLSYQIELRNKFSNQIPLDVEFRLFNS